MTRSDCPVWQRITEYVVNAIPEDLCDEDACMDYYAWNVSVEWRGPGDLWAVKHLSYCLSSGGKWDYEPSPSNRTDAWKKRHRFSEEEALWRAREVAHTICVNGLYPADIAAKYGPVASESRA